MNKDYLLYLLKSKKHLNIFLLITSLIPTVVYVINGFDIYSFYVSFGLFTGISFLQALLLPLINFNYLQSKRALDTYYNIPISKKSLFINNYVFILAQVLVSNLIGIILPLLSSFRYDLNIINVAILFIVWVLFIVMFILFTITIVYKTYSTIDSVLILIAYLLMPVCVMIVIAVFSSTYIFGVSSIFSFIFEYLSIVYIYFYQMVMILSTILSKFTYAISLKDIIMLLEVVGIIVIAILSITHDYKNRKAELSETNSSNFFAYPFVIGFIIMCGLLTINLSNVDTGLMVIFMLIMFITYLTMTFIYRRKVQITKKDLLLFATSIIVSFAITSLATATDSFGLNTLYRNVEEMEDLFLSVNIHHDETSYNVNVRRVDIEDEDTIKAIIAYEDDLYASFKNDNLYNYGQFVYTNISYLNQNEIDFGINGYLYYDDYSEFNKLFNLINEVEEVEIFKSYYDNVNQEYVDEQLTLDNFKEEIAGLF